CFENKWMAELEAIIGDRNGFIRAVDIPRALNLDVSKRDGYILEEITAAMKQLGFEKRPIYIAKEYRRVHEKDTQQCYVRGSEWEGKEPIALKEVFEYARTHGLNL